VEDPLQISPEFIRMPRPRQIRFLANTGLLVHPCTGPRDPGTDPGKQPLWQVPRRLRASLQERLEAFDNNDCNLGVVPRPPHLIIDFDIVKEEDIPRGLMALELMRPELFAENVLRVKTWRGYHIHIFCPDVPASQQKLLIENYLPGINAEIFVGDGLNVILPPSVHPKGLAYEFEGTRELVLGWEDLLKSFNYNPQTQAKREAKDRAGKNESDQKWKQAFKGNLCTLDIVSLTEEIGLYGTNKKETQNGWEIHSIQCPWADEHTPTGEWTEKNTSTVILLKEGFIPRFRCLHGHCADRGTQEFLEWIETEHPGKVDQYCGCDWQTHKEKSRSDSPEETQYRDSAKEHGTDQPDGFYQKVDWTISRSGLSNWKQEIIYPTDSILTPYVEYAQSQTEGADCYILGSILAIIARILARHVYVPFGGKRIYPNIFALLVGPPGDRKSHTIGIADRLAHQLLPWDAFLSRIQSSEALFDEYDEAVGGCPDKIHIVDDAAALLASWRTTAYGESASDTFLTLYDCAALSESFRRNKKDTTNKQSKRYIPETSTSTLYGATPIDAVFAQQKHQQGLSRRFLHYASFTPDRFISWPEEAPADHLTDLFKPLLDLKGPLTLSEAARPLWDQFQRGNRKASEGVPEERPQERYQLASEPTHVLKVASLFEVCRAVHEGRTFVREIRYDTLLLGYRPCQTLPGRG
jgi:hypothetical protein